MMPGALNILVVDDEVHIRFFLRQALERSGHCITEAATGEEAFDLLRETFFDAAILDLNLGGKTDGLRILEAIRWRWPATVVIILTGHGTLQSAMSAIQSGVDGYLLKPVEAGEVRKAVDEAYQRAQRRLSEAQKAGENMLKYGDLSLDAGRHQLLVGLRSVPLTPQEFRLMAHMLASPQRTFGAGELVRVIQEYEPQDEQEGRELIKWYIHRLRKKIEADPSHPQILLNLRGVGYRLGEVGR